MYGTYIYVCMYGMYVIRPSQCTCVCKIHICERSKVDESMNLKTKEEKQGTAVEESVRENIVLPKTLKKERHE